MRARKMEDRYTVAEFAELELNAPEGERWELIGGRIVRMMTGGTIAHNRIVQNTVLAIRSRLRTRGSTCDVFSENVKFEHDLSNSATYPDVIVTCEPTRGDSLAIHSPVILIEVLSKTSVSRDRVEKWHQYAKATSLKAYVLIEQTEAAMEVYTRQGETETWAWSTIDGIDGVLDLPALEISIPLKDVYERVF